MKRLAGLVVIIFGLLWYGLLIWLPAYVLWRIWQ